MDYFNQLGKYLGKVKLFSDIQGQLCLVTVGKTAKF